MENIHATPKDVFLRLFHILTFYLLITSFIALFIQYINALFPDPLNFYFNHISSAVRLAAAMLIIATPAYLISAWFLEKDIQKIPTKRELKIVKWLTYLTLFVSTITIVIDLITFVYNFLSGELSTQFFLKILVVLVVAVMVFGYFLWDLKRTDIKSPTPKKLAWILSVVVLTSVMSGFFIIGTPREQRARRFDSERVNNLQTLQNEIINYWTQKETLPENLSLLEDSISGFITPLDPETKSSYEYIIKTPLTFQLCATFKSTSDDINSVGKNISVPYPASYEMYQQNWSHKAERTCFDRTIDPELYKMDSNSNPKIPLGEIKVFEKG